MPRTVVAEFLYHDAEGVLRYRVQRVEPGLDGRKKDFYQHRSMPDGSWAPSMKAGRYELVESPEGRAWRHVEHGDQTETTPAASTVLGAVQLLLYRLPELLAATKGATIYVVEGEGKVEALRKEGFHATSCTGGASKWRPHYNEWLRGRKVVVLCDNDENGKRHAAQIATTLIGIAASVLIVELPDLPPKGDIVDWFAADHTPAELLALVAAAERSALGFDGFPKPVAASGLKLGDPVKAWLWKGFLARGEITLFSALWKAGKTTLLAHLLKSFERGGSFCGYDAAAGKTLYVTEENEPRWAERRDQLRLGDAVEFLVRPFPAKPRMEQWECLLAYLRLLQQERHYDLIVFDTLANLWPVRDENDASGVQTALMPLHGIIESCAMLLVHHTRKSDGQEATAARGSGALSGFVDTILEFRRYSPKDRHDRKRVITGYGRHDETPGELVIELADGAYDQCGGDRQHVGQKDVLETIRGILPESAPGLTGDQIMDLWPDEEKPNRNRFYAALNYGFDGGLFGRVGEGKKGSPHTYWLATPQEIVDTPFD